MKKYPSVVSRFYLFLGLGTLFFCLVSTGNILYICKKIEWLTWTAQPPYPTIFDFFLLFGIPFWFGRKCTFLTGRGILLYGMGLNLGLGIFGNIISSLDWQFFLMNCMPDKYTYSGFQFVTISSWLALPIGALLGGAAAWIGYKWSKDNFDKQAKLNKK